jgi:hypothetical protein
VLRSSQELAFARLISGQPGKLPPTSPRCRSTRAPLQSWRKSDKPYRVPRRVHLRRSRTKYYHRQVPPDELLVTGSMTTLHECDRLKLMAMS